MLKFDTNNPRAKEDDQFEHFVSSKEWFAFNTIYGTSEEKAFVRMLDRQMQRLQSQYDPIYLLRNEIILQSTISPMARLSNLILFVPA